MIDESNLTPMAVVFLRAHQRAWWARVSPRSRYRGVAEALAGRGFLRKIGYTRQHGGVYEFTPDGRALLGLVAAAGHRLSRVCRRSGALVSVFRCDEAALDTDGGPYATVCETHGTIVNHCTFALARAHACADGPLDWCEDCRQDALIRGVTGCSV